MRRLLAIVFLVMSPFALPAQDRPTVELPAPSTLVVQVRAADGTPIPGFALVRLYSMFLSIDMQKSTIDGGRATFSGITAGEYRLEVTAAGYDKAEEEVQVLSAGITAYAMINLRPEGSPAPAKPPGPPLLAPKARREMEQGQEALKADKIKEAIEHLEKALKMAPGYPDISYLLGAAYQRANRLPDAKTSLEKALALNPNHAAALNALAALHLGQSENDKALQLLERSLLVEPNSWKTHWMLAAVRARMREWVKSLEHTDKAIELSAGIQPEMFVLRGQLLDVLGKLTESIAQFEEFLTIYPDRPEAPSVRQRLERVKAKKSAPPQTALVPAATAAAPATTPPIPTSVVEKEAETLNVKWIPPDIDESKPPLEPGATCALPEVLRGARSQATRLVENLQSFTAVEKVSRQMFDARVGSQAEWTFEYQALIEQPRRGHLAVTDYRTAKSEGVARNVQSNGIPALALILHPFYADDFEMSCEGRAMLDGQAAWLVRFKQRADRPPRVRSYTQMGRRYPVKLKGRAWISVNTSQVMRLETDSIEPIPELRITRDHMVINYAPVKFEKRNVRVWLPATVDFYTDLGGRRSHFRHTYTDFMLFAVDTRYNIEQKEAPKEGPPN